MSVNNSTNYKLSDGSFTSDFWRWHEDNMKTLQQRFSLDFSLEIQPPQITFPPMPIAASNPLSNTAHSKVTESKQNATTAATRVVTHLARPSFAQMLIDPKLKEAIKKLKNFAETDASNARAKNLYSHFKAAFITPINQLELGGEWSNPYDLKQYSLKYAQKILSTNGYGSDSNDIISFIESYIQKFPELHQGVL